MASPIRKRSNSGYYHVVQRGVNRFSIFEDDEDRNFFLGVLIKSARAYRVEIHAWCLMSNHTHLLLKADHEALSAMMRCLGSIYAKRFNRRHRRSGPLFEGRFRSVCVESEAQLIAVARYIHRNPITHEEAALFGKYPWSSYRDYMNGTNDTCMTSFVTEIAGGRSELVRMHEEEWPFERHVDIGTAGRMSDDEARKLANIILRKAGIAVGISRIGALARGVRDRAIALVRHAIDCPFAQLQRLTAVPYSAIRTASKIALANPGPIGRLDSELAFATCDGTSLAPTELGGRQVRLTCSQV